MRHENAIVVTDSHSVNALVTDRINGTRREGTVSWFPQSAGC